MGDKKNNVFSRDTQPATKEDSFLIGITKTVKVPEKRSDEEIKNYVIALHNRVLLGGGMITPDELEYVQNLIKNREEKLKAENKKLGEDDFYKILKRITKAPVTKK